MSHPTAIYHLTVRFLTVTGLAAVSSGALAGASSNAFVEVTVRPGSSVVCASSPRAVDFEAPAGNGTRNARQDGTMVAGVPTGGRRVLLGQWFE